MDPSPVCPPFPGVLVDGKEDELGQATLALVAAGTSAARSPKRERHLLRQFSRSRAPSLTWATKSRYHHAAKNRSWGRRPSLRTSPAPFAGEAGALTGRMPEPLAGECWCREGLEGLRRRQRRRSGLGGSAPRRGQRGMHCADAKQERKPDNNERDKRSLHSWVVRRCVTDRRRPVAVTNCCMLDCLVPLHSTRRSDKIRESAKVYTPVGVKYYGHAEAVPWSHSASLSQRMDAEPARIAARAGRRLPDTPQQLVEAAAPRRRWRHPRFRIPAAGLKVGGGACGSLSSRDR